MFKRLISLLLVFVMVLGMVPVAVWAEETEPAATEEVVEETAAETTEGTTAPVETTVPEETAVPAESEIPTEAEMEAPEETAPAASVQASEAASMVADNLIVGGILAEFDQGNGAYLYDYWTIDNKGVLEITLNAPDPGYRQDGWANYKDRIRKVVLPYGVYLHEQKYSLENCPYLEEADIAMEDIPDRMFYGCEKLERVTMDDTVISIGMYAFRGCIALTDFHMPDDLGYIDSFAFAKCESLKTLRLPEQVGGFGQNVFDGCKSLTDIKLPANLTRIPHGIFANCTGLTEFEIPEGITEVESSAFNTCTQLRSINFPEGLTEIGSNAFTNCKLLPAQELPDSLESIGREAFRNCDLWEEITIPKNVRSIGTDAFENTDNPEAPLKFIVDPANAWYSSDSRGVLFNKDKTTLIRAANPLPGVYKVPNTVKTIDRRAFYCCRELTEVKMPDTLANINERAFYGCADLIKVNIPSSVKVLWSELFYGVPLKELILPEGVEKINSYAFGAGLDKQSDITNLLVPASLKELGFNAFGALAMDNVYFMGNAPYLVGFDYPDWQPPTDSEVPFCGRGYDETDDSYIKTNFYYRSDNETFTDEAKVLLAGKNANWMTYEKGEEPRRFKVLPYVDNHTITINGSGSAFAYYNVEPVQEDGTEIHYILENENRIAKVENGVFSVPLGSFDTVGQKTFNLDIVKIGEEEIEPAIPVSAAVTVAPLSFSQEWQISMDGRLAASLQSGASAKMGSVKAEASLGKLSAGVSASPAITMGLEHVGDAQTMSLTTDLSLGAFGNAFFGPTLKLDKNKKPQNQFTLGSISGEVSAAGTGIYGIKIDDFDWHNETHRKLVGYYCIGSNLDRVSNMAIVVNPMANLLSQCLIRDIDGKMESMGADVIEGYGVAATVSGQLGVANMVVDGKELFSGLQGSAELAMSSDILHSSSGEIEKSSSYKGGVRLEALTLGTYDGSSPVDTSLLSKDFLSHSISMKAKNGNSLEAKYAIDDAGVGVLLYGGHTETRYAQFTFLNEAFRELGDRLPEYERFALGKTKILTVADITKLAKTLPDFETGIAYSGGVQDEYLYTVGLNLGAALGIGADVGLSLSYLENTNYETKSGWAKDDGYYITGVSDDDIDAAVTLRSTSLGTFLSEGLNALMDDVAAYKNKVVKAIQEGVRDTWAWIQAKTETDRNWKVSLEYVTDGNEGQALACSYTIATFGTRNRTRADAGVSIIGDYSVTKAATVGRPFLVDVIDGDTGETVADFREEPLTFTIRYAAEDLEAAGVAARGADVSNIKIAMYRCSDEGEYFEYIGGQKDPEAMTVTAEITEPGQYILAVDSCAPEVTDLELSDYHANPTITAYVSDLSGLDLSRFVFGLDGEKAVDSGNISDHFDSKTGKFTYAVQSAGLSEGEHTMFFTLADTTGNCETYTYTFSIDLTAPVIEEPTVTGTTNEGSLAQIRVKVSDDHLSRVYAMFSRPESDSSPSKEVAVEMVQLEDGSWGLDYKGDGHTIQMYIVAEDSAKNIAKSAVYTVKPYVEAVNLSEEHITLRACQNCELHVKTDPEEFASQVIWTSDNENIITVEDGKVTAKAAGTAYVIATVIDGGITLTDRCRVDVAKKIEIAGVQLGSQKVTTELYSTNYTELKVLLKLPQNYAPSSIGEDKPQKGSVAIESARFKDNAEMNRLFELIPLDDRRLAVVPTGNAIKEAKTVKGSYKGIVEVTVDGTAHTAGELTLTVKKSMPKLTGNVADFNSFYNGQTREILISGGTVVSIAEDESKNKGKTTAIPEWLELTDGILTLTEDAPLKNVSGKACLLVETEEWRIPAEVTVNVKNSYKAPGLKLSATNVTFTSDWKASSGVDLKLEPKNKKDSLAAMEISGIADPEGFEIEGFNRQTGEFTLKPTRIITPGKITLDVSVNDTTVTVPLTLTVKVAAPSLKLSAKSVTLNTAVDDSVAIAVTVAPADHILGQNDVKVRVTDSKDNPSADVTAQWDAEKGIICVKAKETASGNYKLYVSLNGGKETAVTVKTVNQEPTVALKAAGNLDLSFPDTPVMVTANFKNYSGEIVKWSDSITEMSGKTTLDENAREKFTVEQEGNSFRIYPKKDAELNAKNTYTLKLDLELAGGKKLSPTVSLKVKRTAVKLKLSTSKVTLNNKVKDGVTVDVSCTTKGYSLGVPIIEVKDTTGKISMADKLSTAYSNGKLTISVNDKTAYGATYKVILKADAYSGETPITVTIPEKDKSDVTVTTKLSGSLDVIRKNGFITLTPTYKNCNDLAERENSLLFYRVDGKDLTEVKGLFTYKSDEKGGYIITIVDRAKVDHSQKYQVKLVSRFTEGTEIEEAESKPASLSVKMGSAKAELDTQEVILFAEDIHSRGDFGVELPDTTLKDIDRIEIKDKKYVDLLEIKDYENGRFAMAFKNNIVDESLKGKSVTVSMDVYLKGNMTAKANASLRLKVTTIP